MDVRNNLGSSTPYPSYVGAQQHYGGSSDVSDVDESRGYLARPRTMPSGDSLMMSAQVALRQTEELRALRERRVQSVLKAAQVVLMVVFSISFVLFAILALQPFLALIFSFGDCVANGCDDWLEFAFEGMSASLFVAAVMLVAGILVLLIQLLRMSEQSEK